MYDIIIVGGGVAAFSAALFAARRGLVALIIAKDIGGQANFTDVIQNYPGILEVGGFELVNTIRQQAVEQGAKILVAEVSKIKKVGQEFILTAQSKQYKARALALAFGKTPRDLAVTGEEEFKGRGVSYCCSCDAPLYKNKTVAVVGVGDLALDAALLSAKYAKKVYVLSKTDKITGHPALLKALGKKKNIELIPFVQIQAVKGKDKVESLRLLNLKTQQAKDLLIDGIFVELGYVVKSDFIKDLVAVDELDQIIVDQNQQTSVPGIFAAGDASSRTYKQAAISAGEGITAALAAYDWLMHQGGGKGLTSDWTQIKRVK